MGDIAIAPSDTNVIWAGTGEEDARNSILPGGGIYKSELGAPYRRAKCRLRTLPASRMNPVTRPVESRWKRRLWEPLVNRSAP